ncbi:MAG: hypothetical protein ACRYGK_04865 [Janthinobacterium lividum]
MPPGVFLQGACHRHRSASRPSGCGFRGGGGRGCQTGRQTASIKMDGRSLDFIFDKNVIYLDANLNISYVGRSEILMILLSIFGTRMDKTSDNRTMMQKHCWGSQAVQL